MQVLALLRGKSTLFMVKASSFPVSPDRISLNWFWQSKLRQLLNQRKELLIRDGQWGEPEGLLLSFVLFSSLLSGLAIWRL